jgi:rhodanese-related sulfurtransferase
MHKTMRPTSIFQLIPGRILILLAATLLASCGKGDLNNGSCKSGIPVLDESRMIAEYMEKNGDPTKCQDVCIKADELSALLGSNIHIIDLRSGPEYKSLHIPSAVNVPLEKFEFHFNKTHKALMFNKVVLVCDDGLESAYAASLMRQFGFDNVHVLEWGMSGWNQATAGAWLSAIAEKKAEVNISTEEFLLADRHPSPVIKTGKLWREDILHARVKSLLKTGFRGVGVGPEALMDKGNLIIAYCSKEDYDRGHPAGAIHFPLGKSLQTNSMLNLLPPDKPIVLYSRNGFESAYACAYLRTLGYQAKVLMYGMNCFMNSADMGEGQSFHLASTPRYTLLGKDVGSMNFQAQAIKESKAPEAGKPPAEKKQKVIELKPKAQEAESEGC